MIARIPFLFLLSVLFREISGEDSCSIDGVRASCQGNTSRWKLKSAQDYLTSSFSTVEAPLHEVRDWIHKLGMKTVVIFCKPENVDVVSNVEALAAVRINDNCPKQGANAAFNGKLDRHYLPKGRGILSRNERPVVSINPDEPCLELGPGIKRVTANFLKGLPSGSGVVTYDNGMTSEGHFKAGVMVGQVKLLDRLDLTAIQHLVNGRPHGATWVVSADVMMDGALLIHFDSGSIDRDVPAIFLPPEGDTVIVGRLEGTHTLTNVVEVVPSKFIEWNCMKLPLIDDTTLRLLPESKKTFKLPFKFYIDASGKWIVETTKLMFFNRIAKTGSQALIALLVDLEEKNKFTANIDITKKGKEYTMEPPELVAKQVAKVQQMAKKPGVFIKHYNFVDFEEHKASVRPDFFAVVRNPIDRVSSWFYYWRSSWNIVSRIMELPDEPLPDLDTLKKDFDSCVLDGDPECTYIEGTHALGFGDHRSQMMAFCGHDPKCASFNDQWVLQRAKENVEKHYPVVGVLEHLNITLSVAEWVHPNIFKGAQELYYKSKGVKKFKNRNAFKLPVSDEVKQLLQANFTREIEFYDFCKQRLFNQYEEYKLQN